MVFGVILQAIRLARMKHREIYSCNGVLDNQHLQKRELKSQDSLRANA